MELNLVLIYFFILYSDFTFSKDIIEAEGIPSHWKRYHEVVRNPHHHKINSIQNKKSTSNIINHGLEVQRPTKIVPNNLQSYKIMQPTINTTNRSSNSISDMSNKKLCGSDTRTAHTNENWKAENKNVAYDKQLNNINEHNKDKDQVLEKYPMHTETQNASNEFKNVNTFEKPDHAEMDIKHENDLLKMLLPPKTHISSNFLEKLRRNKGLTKKSDEAQEHKDIANDNREQNKNGNDEYILKNHDNNERNQVSTDEIKNDEISFDNQKNVQAKLWHAINDPKGWIRYIIPNQYSLSDNSNNYINRLYSQKKYSNPFYDTRGRLTSHLNYGADIRYSRPDVRY